MKFKQRLTFSDFLGMIGLMIKDFFGKLKKFCLPCIDNSYRPRFLSTRNLFYYGISLLALKLLIIPFILSFPGTTFFADITKTSLIQMTNNARQYQGLQPLAENTVLDSAAYLKAKDMLDKGYFAHYSPTGVAPWHWVSLAGYNYKSAGENLAIGFYESGQVHQAWMNSPGHAKNILNPNYQEIGIAVLTGNFQGGQTTLVVQFFGAKQVASVPVQTPKTETKIAKEQPVPETPVVAGQEEIAQEPVAEELASEPAEEEATPSESAVVYNEVEKTPGFFLFQFMTSDYYDWIRKIIYGSLILILIALLITFLCDLFVYRKFEIQYKDIILKGALFTALWLVLLFLDKMIIIQLIASNFRIN
ncbi:MAG: hypothetical protein FJZ05_01420 [Candidatus Nealsonbacteria bacterium]|nr:hypothetical protein [Candidatus Nealsonbacteria bacterium]